MKNWIIICLLVVAGPLRGQVAFPDRTEVAGIPDLRAEGLAIADYNGDGYPDIYVTFAFGPNQLLENDGAGGFQNVAPDLGVALDEAANTRVAAWGDFDNDGDPDLYLASRDQSDRLFRNDAGQFTPLDDPIIAAQFGNPKAISLADFDNDGWLDIYVSNFNAQNALLMNQGDATFVNRTLASGATDTGTSMATICYDHGQDGDLDILLVKDANQTFKFYENDGNAQFTDRAAELGLDAESFGMGADVADVNGDGLLDIYVTNLSDNFLFIAQTDGSYTEVANAAGVADPGMGWGCTFLEIDNDGRPDLYLANEYGFSPFENKLYRNEGDADFEDVLEFDDVSNTQSTYGCLPIDVDLDGRQDLLVANRNPGEQAQYFRNESVVGNYLQLRLVGVESNRQAIGAAVRILDDHGRLHYQEISAGSSWLSQKGGDLHFGLGSATGWSEAIIRWPSGLEQSIPNLTVNNGYVIEEGQLPQLGLTSEVASTTSINAPNPEAVIFPNPYRVGYGPLSVKLATSLVRKSIELIDLRGQVVLTYELDPEEQQVGTVNLPAARMADLPAGLYWVRLTGASSLFPLVISR